MKIKIVILITVLVIIFAMCWFGYLHSASEKVKDAFYESTNTIFFDKDILRRLNFEVNKNKGISILLCEKTCNIFDICYQFDNGTVRGFINIMSPDSIMVLFSNCNAPDSYYRASSFNFSLEEVKEMLGTITFDGGDIKQ